MLSVTDIQAQAILRGRNSGIDLTTADGEYSLNRILRRLAAALPWSEFTRTDITTTTMAGTGAYLWPLRIAWA